MWAPSFTLYTLNTHIHIRAYAEDVNLLGDNIDTVKKNTGTFGSLMPFKRQENLCSL
jgi:hypothetical protein